MGISSEKELRSLAASSLQPCSLPPKGRAECWCAARISSSSQRRNQMSSAAEFRTHDSIAAKVQATRRAARELARLSVDQRNQILLVEADALEAREAEILKANREDCESLERELAAGAGSDALLKRLK